MNPEYWERKQSAMMDKSMKWTLSSLFHSASTPSKASGTPHKPTHYSLHVAEHAAFQGVKVDQRLRAVDDTVESLQKDLQVTVDWVDGRTTFGWGDTLGQSEEGLFLQRVDHLAMWYQKHCM